MAEFAYWRCAPPSEKDGLRIDASKQSEGEIYDHKKYFIDWRYWIARSWADGGSKRTAGCAEPSTGASGTANGGTAGRAGNPKDCHADENYALTTGASDGSGTRC